jgi:hypothetical protein
MLDVTSVAYLSGYMAKSANAGRVIGGTAGAGVGYLASEKPADWLAERLAPFLEKYLTSSQSRHDGLVSGQVKEQARRNRGSGEEGQGLDTRAIMAVDKVRGAVANDPQALIRKILQGMAAVGGGVAGMRLGGQIDNRLG